MTRPKATPMSTALHHDEQVIAIAKDVLADIARRSSSLTYASILTDDGFEVASQHGLVARNGGRFASIASSLQALGEAAVRELQLGGSSSVLVSSDQGHIVQVRVQDSTLVLAALFGTGETLGHALATTRHGAAELGQRLPRRG